MELADFGLDKFKLFCNTSAAIQAYAGQDCQPILVSSRAVYLRVRIMVIRITKILSASVLLLVLANVQLALGDWSLLHPFGGKSETTSKQSDVKTVKKEKDPSAWEKVSGGTKKLFSRPGEALGLKKSEAKQYTSATPKPQTVQSPKKEESKSWWNPLAPAEPKKPKTVSDWMANKRLDP